MRKPEKLTITAFWLDWLLLPITLGAAWLTFRWAMADFRLASSPDGMGALSPWAVAIPLVVCAASWVIVGLGSLIRDEYYEHRIWVTVLIAWSLGCIIGAVLIGLSFLSGGSDLGLAGILSLIGLALMAMMLSLPACIKVPLGAKSARFSHQWTVLLVASTGCLMAGMLLGFPYNFPRFSLGIGAFSFFGLGALEAAFSTPAFPWLPRLYNFKMGQETFLEGLPKSNMWRIEGLIKLVIGIGTAVTLVIASL
ncbi:MAG: hypothetical protein JW726_02710 [Anaerolineales bacterium]|nr:hypothetical protein [Anaerolineales bacterium]